MMPKFPYAFAALLLTAIALPAQAEKGDREKPMNIEADRMSMDDIKKIQVFEGNVIVTQGTMQLLTNRLVVTQDADGFQKGVATGGAGGLARFKQKRDGVDEYMEGEAERIVRRRLEHGDDLVGIDERERAGKDINAAAPGLDRRQLQIDRIDALLREAGPDVASRIIPR